MDEKVVALMSMIGIVFGAGGFASVFFQRKKTEAQAKLVESKADINYAQLANDWISRLQSRISELESEVASLKEVINDQWRQIAALVSSTQGGK
jgi:hypothetical protein